MRKILKVRRIAGQQNSRQQETEVYSSQLWSGFPLARCAGKTPSFEKKMFSKHQAHAAPTFPRQVAEFFHDTYSDDEFDIGAPVDEEERDITSESDESRIDVDDNRHEQDVLNDDFDNNDHLNDVLDDDRQDDVYDDNTNDPVCSNENEHFREASPIPIDNENNGRRSDVAANDTDDDEMEIDIAAAEDVPHEAFGDYKSDWCKNLEDFPPALTFSATPGMQGPLYLPSWDACRPVDFYKLFIDQELLELITNETNRYAKQMLDTEREGSTAMSRLSSVNTWKVVTVQEISHFLAILLHMSIVRKPRVDDYWSTRPMFQISFVSKLMTNSRFRQILAFFHLNDNCKSVPREHPDYDSLYKVRPLIDHLSHLFKSVYIPKQQIRVEKVLCSWKDRVDFDVHLKEKFVKQGIQLYELCESESGYVYNFEVFCYRSGISNKPSDIVYRLVQPLTSLGYCLYADEHCCSLKVAQSLASKNTGLVGLVKPNERGLPKHFMEGFIRTGEVQFRRFKNAVLLKWNDKSKVSVITTFHRPQMVVVKTAAGEHKKPTVIVDYAKNMSGSINLNSYTPLRHKSIKWWKKLTFYLLTLAVTQAHILYTKVQKQIGEPAMCLEDFILSVGEDLANLPGQENGGNITETATSTDRDHPHRTERHFIEPCPNRICVVCSAKANAEGVNTKRHTNIVKLTKFQCRQCKKPLCPYPCMEIYHTEKDIAKK